MTFSSMHMTARDSSPSCTGIAWYKAIVEHVHGTTNTDIRKAKYALESLKVFWELKT
jgi:hypothetical protein